MRLPEGRLLRLQLHVGERPYREATFDSHRRHLSKVGHIEQAATSFLAALADLPPPAAGRWWISIVATYEGGVEATGELLLSPRQAIDLATAVDLAKPHPPAGAGARLSRPAAYPAPGQNAGGAHP